MDNTDFEDAQEAVKNDSNHEGIYVFTVTTTNENGIRLPKSGFFKKQNGEVKYFEHVKEGHYKYLGKNGDELNNPDVKIEHIKGEIEKLLEMRNKEKKGETNKNKTNFFSGGSIKLKTTKRKKQNRTQKKRKKSIN